MNSADLFGVELNLEELKMAERVKVLKRQKVKHQGDALLGTQDYIGFAKRDGTEGGDRLMMDYEYVEGEASQLRENLIKGRVTEAPADMQMDSEELEAMEEEEKLVRDMVKKGTMSKRQECDEDDYRKAVDGDEDISMSTDGGPLAYERSKQYRQMQGIFFSSKTATASDLPQTILDLEAKGQADITRQAEITNQLSESSSNIEDTKVEIE